MFSVAPVLNMFSLSLLLLEVLQAKIFRGDITVKTNVRVGGTGIIRHSSHIVI